MLPLLPIAGLLMEGVKYGLSYFTKDKEMKKQAASERLQLHMERLKDTQKSWKDELITIWILLIVSAAIIGPWIGPHYTYKVVKSMEMIKNLPEPLNGMFEAVVYIGIGAELLGKGVGKALK